MLSAQTRYFRTRAFSEVAVPGHEYDEKSSSNHGSSDISNSRADSSRAPLRQARVNESHSASAVSRRSSYVMYLRFIVKNNLTTTNPQFLFDSEEKRTRKPDAHFESKEITSIVASRCCTSRGRKSHIFCRDRLILPGSVPCLRLRSMPSSAKTAHPTVVSTPMIRSPWGP